MNRNTDIVATSSTEILNTAIKDFSSTQQHLRDVGSNIIDTINYPHIDLKQTGPLNALTHSNTVATRPHSDTPPTTHKKKIAYAITVTKDGAFLDGALVLGYGIMKTHQHSANKQYWDQLNRDEVYKNHDTQKHYIPTMSKYEADLIAFVTPEIVHAKHILGKQNYPVN